MEVKRKPTQGGASKILYIQKTKKFKFQHSVLSY